MIEHIWLCFLSENFETEGSKPMNKWELNEPALKKNFLWKESKMAVSSVLNPNK
jgi:hypothetical protein